jgi:hypothetical protein
MSNSSFGDRRAKTPRRGRSLAAFVESLEDRRLMAASYTDGELLIQYASAASAAARDGIRALDSAGNLASYSNYGATIAVGRGTGTIVNDDGLSVAQLAAFASFDAGASATKRK